ncbi:MAG: type II toxin-antitoxin system Phd/YefM family antitoxin [Polyangia bacterium]
MEITASELRSNIYKIIDRVLRTGERVEIRRKNDRVMLVPCERASKLSRLERRDDYVVGDPDELVHLDWFDEWSP